MTGPEMSRREALRLGLAAAVGAIVPFSALAPRPPRAIWLAHAEEPRAVTLQGAYDAGGTIGTRMFLDPASGRFMVSADGGPYVAV